jgi:hypothetical protein
VFEYQGSSGLAWTCSPSGLPRYVVNGDGTLTDHQTGLMWEITTSACSGEYTCVNNEYEWSASGADADGSLFTSFLATLNGGVYYSTANRQDVSTGPGACFANHCDWRIPTIAELDTIIDTSAPGCGSGSPCIDPAFGPTQPSYVLYHFYWASTSLPYTPSYNAWIADFDTGLPSQWRKTDDWYARAVRSAR